MADGSLSNSKFEVSEGEAPRRSTAPAVVLNQESGVTQSPDIIDNPDSSGKPNAGSETVGSQTACETSNAEHLDMTLAFFSVNFLLSFSLCYFNMAATSSYIS